METRRQERDKLRKSCLQQVAVGAQASGVSVGINRSLWNYLAGGGDDLQPKGPQVFPSWYAWTPGTQHRNEAPVLHASGEKTVNITPGS